jgi:AbrB family looped-hinge helix DNA binding protein
MTTRVTRKRQIVLPPEICKQDDIKPGQQFDVQRINRGEYRLVLRAQHLNEGLVDWLLACPVKDFFVPIASESSDHVPITIRG